MEPSKNQVAQDAKGIASKVVDQAKDQVHGQQERSAGDLQQVADALHRTSEDLGDNVAAPYVEKAASFIERASGSVRNANFRETVAATERFARREPLLFVGGAFVLGLLAARFLKSSSRQSGSSESNEAPRQLSATRSQAEQTGDFEDREPYIEASGPAMPTSVSNPETRRGPDGGR